MLVSVVIPTFRRPKYLSAAIRSVLEGSHDDVEIIVVDDANDQETCEAVSAFAESRVTYTAHLQSRGGGAARNTGILRASGSVIAFLDDDDTWLPNRIAHQLAFLNVAEASVCGFLLKSTYRAIIPRFTNLTIDVLRAGNMFPTPALMVRADAIRAVMFDERLPNGQDWDLLVRLAERQPIQIVREPLFIYNDGQHQRISNISVALNWEELRGRRLAAIIKHTKLLGPYWTKFRSADELLSFLRDRPDLIAIIYRTCVQFGFLPTFHALTRRLVRKITRRLFAAPAISPTKQR